MSGGGGPARVAGGAELGYRRGSLRPTVVHIGPGVFHRAHQAVYADDVLRTGSTAGAIWGVSLRSPSVRDALAPAGYLYHVLERDGDGDGGRRPPPRPVGALLGIDVAAGEPGPALARLADPAVTVVTITVTEHGYCAVDPGGPLDTSRPEIVHDLGRSHAPCSLPGLLVEALAQRRSAGIAPFAVASCDNLPRNGAAAGRVVTELAEHRDPSLAAWIRDHVAFPSSMVDRMVPATSDADRRHLALLGIDDAWPVVTEPFSQWVLEDTFPAGRPPWERVGVELVAGVDRHEQAKLRILNAAHSALAYWGLLAGHDRVAGAAADPALAAAVRELISAEVIPTLTAPPGWDLAAYAAQVLGRFANRSLPYTTAKVAGDGSQKLAVRLLPTVRFRLAAGLPAPRAALVLAAWVTCTAGPRAPSFALSDPALASARTAGGATSRPVVPAGVRRSGAEAAVDALLWRPGFLDRSDPTHRAFASDVTGLAGRLWTGDVRQILASPPDTASGPPGPDDPRPR